jgi:L-threonylcarbamoyladenylate synthase
MVETVALEISARGRELMAHHWPGALTLVLHARPEVPDEVTAGSGTVGVRLSAHPIARGLVRALGQPVTAPSANPAGLAAPTTAAQVLAHFRGRIEVVLDGGATAGGEPSTVLDVTVDPPRLVRAGAVRIS